MTGLYFWTFFAPNAEAILGGLLLLVSMHVAVLAVVTIGVSGVLWLFAPRKEPLLMAPLTVYLALSVMLAALVMDSGGAYSPFITLWVLVSVFAAAFGVYALGPVLAATTTYIIMLVAQDASLNQIIVAGLAGILPISIGLLLWSKPGGRGRGSGTARKAADYRQPSQELNEMTEQSEPIINAIGDGVIAIDAHGVVQLINPAALTALGWSRQDALTLNYKSVLKLVDASGAELASNVDPVAQVLNSNQPERIKDAIIMTKNDKKINVALVISPIGQAGSGVIIVFRDVTKERAEEREQAEFISTASHEMRTPVASIEGYLGLALNPTTAQIDDKAREFIVKAQESAAHLGRLFQDLLDVTRAEDGRLSNNPKVIDAVAFTGDVVEGLRSQAEKKGLQLHYKPGASLREGDRKLSPVYYAYLDKDHVREIVGNLTENAIKYTLAGEVEVDVRGSDEHITVSVRDSGIGIPAEDLPHLFQKFYRVDNTDTREIGGTGLGLYLCRRLAESMGGRVWAESVYKQGSTFYLELPRVSREEAETLKADEEAGVSHAQTNVEDAKATFNSNTDSNNSVQSVTAPPPASEPALQPVSQPSQPPAQQQHQQVPPLPVQAQPQSLQQPIVPDANNVPLSQIESDPNNYRDSRQQGRINVPPRR